jgi:hypothetical protein
MKLLWNMDKAEMLSNQILFQEEDKDSYIGSMLSRFTAGATP